MHRLRWLLAAFFIITLPAFGSTSWAESKYKPNQQKPGWEDQWHESSDNHPPGWDKGKKTGWQGHDLPPGQEKKYRARYKSKVRRGDEPRPVTPEPVPIPVPVPVPVPTPR